MKKLNYPKYIVISPMAKSILLNSVNSLLSPLAVPTFCNFPLSLCNNPCFFLLH